MILLLLGIGMVALLLLAAQGFSRARIATLRSLLEWIMALGGLAMGALLLLGGRWPGALAALVAVLPLLRDWWSTRRPAGPSGARPSGSHRSGTAGGTPPPRGPRPSMTRAEALDVLGLKPGADADAIRAAHRRLMRAAHPDIGGSDWIAARINQARDILLG